MNAFSLIIVLISSLILSSCSLMSKYDKKKENTSVISDETRKKCPVNKIPAQTSRLLNNANYPGIDLKLVKVLSSCNYINSAQEKSDLFINFAAQLIYKKTKKNKYEQLNRLTMYIAIVNNNKVLAKVLVPLSNHKTLKVAKDKEFIEVRNKFKYSYKKPINNLYIYYGIQIIKPQLTNRILNNQK